jgi:dihydrofolate synthase/folylpolyglutamate synthase
VNFNEAEKYLLSLGNEVTAMKLGLENVSKLFAELGDPQKNYLKVQVAGTNGKGSVCAFLNSICVTAGIRTGMYTSPHLISITERIQIDGVSISEDEFERIATHVRTASEILVARGELESVPTFFEQVTAIALVAFAEAKVELAILETGLGGRLDATTAANAEIAAITRIDIDHQQYLGDTIEEIAGEKAAIIHKGSKVVIGDQPEAAMKIVLQRCRALEVAPRLASHAILPTERIRLGIAGDHQIENSRVAVSLVELLREKFPITDHQIVTGIETARHPGRLERLGRFLLDGTHNPGGARALKVYLDQFAERPITLVFGAMNDKATSEILSILVPAVDRLILTRPNNSRAADPADISRQIPKPVIIEPNVSDALKKAVEISGEEDVILVTGSLYLVGEVRAVLKDPFPTN